MPNKIFIAIIQSLRKLLDRSNMASGKRTAVLGDSAGRVSMNTVRIQGEGRVS